MKYQGKAGIWAVVGVSLLAQMAAGAAEDAAAGDGQDQPMSVVGTVQSFNLGNRGEVNGLIVVVDGKMVQVNFPPHQASVIKGKVKAGDRVTALVMPDRGPPRPRPRDAGDGDDPHRPVPPPPPRETIAADHPVYRLLELADARGNPVTFEKGRKPVQKDGVVEAINYEGRGNMNGVQLKTGELVLISPRDAAGLRLKVGERVSVEGTTDPSPEETVVIRAQMVNGTVVSPGGPPPQGPEGEGGPPPAPDGGPEGAAPPPPP